MSRLVQSKPLYSIEVSLSAEIGELRGCRNQKRAGGVSVPVFPRHVGHHVGEVSGIGERDEAQRAAAFWQGFADVLAGADDADLAKHAWELAKIPQFVAEAGEIARQLRRYAACIDDAIGKAADASEEPCDAVA
jgi:hypothetical protein